MRRHRLTAAITVLVALPILLPPVLPLADLGGHMGRYTVQLAAGSDPLLSRWYSFEWDLIPNLGVDLIVELLGPIFGTEPAVRFAVFLAVALMALGILSISRAIHGRITIGAVLALPLIYNFAFHFGFLNFMLGSGLALCGCALWVWMEDRPAWQRWLGFALVASLIWLCHLVGWGVFCVAIGTRELLRQVTLHGILRGFSNTGVLLSCVIIPVLLGEIFGPEGLERGQTREMFNWGLKSAGLLYLLRDRWMAFDLLTVGLIIGLCAILWVTYRKLLDPGLVFAAGMLVMLILVIPHQLFGSEFADVRLMPVALILALLAPGQPEGKAREVMARALMAAALVIAGGRLVYNAASIYVRGWEAERALTVLDALPRGAQLVTFRAIDCVRKPGWELEWRWHLAGYALVRKHAFASDQWQIAGAQLLTIHNPAVRPYESFPVPQVPKEDCFALRGLARRAAEMPPAVSHLWVLWDGSTVPLSGWKALSISGESILYQRSP